MHARMRVGFGAKGRRDTEGGAYAGRGRGGAPSVPTYRRIRVIPDNIFLKILETPAWTRKSASKKDEKKNWNHRILLFAL